MTVILIPLKAKNPQENSFHKYLSLDNVYSRVSFDCIFDCIFYKRNAKSWPYSNTRALSASH